MRESPIRAALLAATALLSACSQRDEPRQTSESVAVDIAQDRAAPPAAERSGLRVPGISPQAAPGVAFSYRYRFVLPDEAIAGVQEQHAAACEKLGPNQCRITGMRYTLLDEDEVRAVLDFKLSPELARQFGKDGITAVEKARGKLVDAAIEGEDVGSQISASQQRSAGLKAELTRIEQRLAAGGLGDSERVELQQQAERLRQQMAGEQGGRAEGEERLASTPMHFDYTGDAGFTLGGNPFGDAAHSAWASFVTMISFVLLAVGVSLPWLGLLALVIYLLRRWRRRRNSAPAA